MSYKYPTLIRKLRYLHKPLVDNLECPFIFEGSNYTKKDKTPEFVNHNRKDQVWLSNFCNNFLLKITQGCPPKFEMTKHQTVWGLNNTIFLFVKTKWFPPLFKQVNHHQIIKFEALYNLLIWPIWMGGCILTI